MRLFINFQKNQLRDVLRELAVAAEKIERDRKDPPLMGLIKQLERPATAVSAFGKQVLFANFFHHPGAALHFIFQRFYITFVNRSF